VEVVVVLTALYLIECCVWIGADQYAFTGFRAGAFTVHVGPHLPIAGDRGVAIAMPLPLSITVTCDGQARDFDIAALTTRWSAFGESVRLLTPICAIAWFYVLVLTPAVVILRGLAGNWESLLIGWVVILAAILFEFRAGFRTLDLEGDCVSKLVAIALSPFSAVRACDLLARPVVASFHPAAAAYVLCDRAAFVDAARRFYFAAPRAPWHADLKGLLDSTRCLEDVLRPPDREGSHLVSFCPRCHGQYACAEGECRDCPSVPLHSFNALPI